jgi:hypothetical protein
MPRAAACEAAGDKGYERYKLHQQVPVVNCVDMGKFDMGGCFSDIDWGLHLCRFLVRDGLQGS